MPHRDHRLDRAKGFLIFTVVLGHLLARTSPWESEALRVPMYLIYSFHMPAFVFLAGITAKSNRLPERVLTYLVLLATVLPAMWVWMHTVGLDPDYEAFVPFWFTWFLASMACWMLTVPLIERFPRTLLVASVAAGLFGGALPLVDQEFSLARTLVFFPFFVIGKLYGAAILDWAGGLRTWQKLGFATTATATIGCFIVDGVNHSWFYGSLNFASFDVSIPEGVGIRLIVDLGAVLMTVSLLTWIGSSPGLLTTIGRRSLAVYVLHGFVVRGLQPVLDDSRDVVSSGAIALCFVLAVLTTLLLARASLDRALRWYATTVAELLLRLFSRLHVRPGRRPQRRSGTNSGPASARDADSGATSAR